MTILSETAAPSEPKPAPLSAGRALNFVVLLGVVSLFADLTYEGARGLNGPYLSFLGASATAVGLAAGAGELGLTNVGTLCGDCTQPNLLPEDTFDRAWLVAVLGEIPDQAAALRQIHRALRPGGTLAVAEVFGIDPHYQSPQTVRRLGLTAGFEPGERLGPWWFFTQQLVKPLKIVERHQDA
jgi:SAM-dependent methyltransferase